jgi:circadian clock protein KaiC
MDEDRSARFPERLSSGVPGLDAVLRGGFLKAGIFLIQGSPGAGKTILANQMCFHHAAEGGRALYVTLLAESHSRMLLHIGQLGFFDASMVPSRIYFVSAFRALEEDGLRGLLDLLRREVQVHKATLLLIDGLVSVEETAASPREYKKFIHELQAQAAMADCTVFLLTSTPTPPIAVEHTMVDGVVQLHSQLYGRRAERHLEVYKMRGTGYLRGEHSFRISDEGVIVYPRTEALLMLPSTRPKAGGGSAVETGLPELDRMTGGGFPSNCTALLTGPPGIGKTTLGLHFLSQSSEECPGLHFGFYEIPEAISAKANALGLPLKDLIEHGHVEVLWQPTTEGILDEACHRLLEAVERRGVKRLFIDGLEGFERLTTDRERLGHIFAAFSNELSARGVTTVYTSEANLIGSVSGLPLSNLPLQGVSCIAEIILVMRYVELRAHLHRVLAVLKVRDSLIDPAFHRFTIAGTGITIESDSAGAEEILSEAARQNHSRDLFRTPRSRRVGPY